MLFYVEYIIWTHSLLIHHTSSHKFQSEETFVKAGLNSTTHIPTISTQPSLNPTILAVEPTFTMLNPTEKPVLAVENTPVPIAVDETLTPTSGQPNPYSSNNPILSIRTTAVHATKPMMMATLKSTDKVQVVEVTPVIIEVDHTLTPTFSQPTYFLTNKPILIETNTAVPTVNIPASTLHPSTGWHDQTENPTINPSTEPTKAHVPWWGGSWDETSELSSRKPSLKPTHKKHTNMPTSRKPTNRKPTNHPTGDDMSFLFRKPTKHPSGDVMSFLFHFDYFDSFDSTAGRSSKSSKKIFPKSGKMSKTMFIKSGKGKNRHDSKDDGWSGVLKASSHLEINSEENKSLGFAWSLSAVTAVALLGFFVSL